jgi:hypothetical protein
MTALVFVFIIGNIVASIIAFIVSKPTAEAHYKKALRLYYQGELYEAKVLFKKAVEQGYDGAQAWVSTIDCELKKKEEKESSRLETLPKCPWCGEPIEQKYVNEFWGNRYYHATYAPDCKWSDDKLREPYRP